MLARRVLLGGAVGLLAVAALAAGCGGGPSTPSQGTPEGEATTRVHVHLDEWTIEPDVAVLHSSGVTLHFDGHNHGGIPHELVIIKTDLDPAKLPVTRGKVDEAAAGEKVGEIEVDELAPGATVEHTFDLDPGRYVLICNVAGHYSQGMYAALTVE